MRIEMDKDNSTEAEVKTPMKSFVRISALLWADILVLYALFVMQNYLTDVWKLSFTHAAGILNVWSGIYTILPSFFLFLVDAFVGHFWMLVISNIAYSVGILFVTLSTPTFLGVCKEYDPQCIGHAQKIIFYIGMALLTIGISGHMVSLEPFLEEQKVKPIPEEQNDKPEEQKDKPIPEDQKDKSIPEELGKLFGFILVVLVPVTGAIALPYIKRWDIRFGIPTVCTIFVTLLFFTGCCWSKYNKKTPNGSPITNVCRVFVASAFNISKPNPKINSKERRVPARLLRFLEKATISPEGVGEGRVCSSCRHCKIKEVEDAQIAVRMVPMWMTFIVVGVVSSIGNTYFIEQAKHMNRHLGKWRVPLPIFKMLFEYAKDFFGAIANCYLKPGEPYVASFGIAVSMVFSVLCCITAAKIENHRIHVIISHGLLDKPDDDIPMSMFWLLFQFILLGGVDSFFQKSVAAFYADQAPESMKAYLSHFSKGVSGLGFLSSVLLVYGVGKVSERGGRTNWFQYTLNRSRLDRYYWFLAALSSVNLIIFIVVATFYRYKKWVERPDVDAAVEVLDQEDESGSCSCFCCG